MTRVNLAEIKAKLSEYVSRALGGELIEVTRRGQPVAVILGPAEYRRLEAARQPGTFAQAAAKFRDELQPGEDLPDLTSLVSERPKRSREVEL